MLRHSMTKILRHGQALLLLIFLAQMSLLGHQVLSDHDEAGSCEICLQAKHSEAAAAPSQLFTISLLVVFVGLFVLATRPVFVRPSRRFSPRAPPQ